MAVSPRSIRGAVVLLAALFLIASSAAPAQGAEVPNHPFLPLRFQMAYTKPPPPYLDAHATPAGAFEDACGVAVDSQGKIYVSDYYHNAIDVFSRSGEYLTQIAAVDPPDGPCGLVVDGAGNVYVNDYHRDVVRYSPAELSSGSGTVIDSNHPTGLAIDPTTDNLYVNNRTYVSAYKPSGEPLLSGGEPLRIGLGTLGDAYGVVVSSFPATEGWVYVADASDDTIKVYDPAISVASPATTIDGAGTPQGGFVSLFDSSMAIDQSNGHLFVSDNTQPGFEHPAAVIDEFGPTGLYRGQLAHAIVDGEPVGIAVDESSTHKGDVYVTSGNGSSDVFPKVPNPEESVLYAFGPAGTAGTLAVSLTGQGTVKSTPAGIACPGACEAEFNSGATVTLSATPAQGSAFAGWSGACSGTGGCQVSMGADAAVGAEFAPAPAATTQSTQNAPVSTFSTSSLAATAPKTHKKHKQQRKHRKAKGKGKR